MKYQRRPERARLPIFTFSHRRLCRWLKSYLLRNNGDNTFVDVSEKIGIASTVSTGLGVVSEDFNDDGKPDLYVANDGYPNQLWLSTPDGRFQDGALITGAAYSWNGVPEAGMGVLAADLDNDGDLDLFMTHLASESNTFYRNLGGARV